jgi:adenylate cyclase
VAGGSPGRRRQCTSRVSQRRRGCGLRGGNPAGKRVPKYDLQGRQKDASAGGVERWGRHCQDDTIFGDGVNVAARLQAMAPTGGICISLLARDHLQDKATYTFEDLGALSLKNIARPVQAFTLIHDPAGQNETTQSKHLDEATPTEISFWESIQESTGSEEYEAYLKQYPEGRFSAVAKARLTDLETTPELPAEEALKVELLFWESVKDSSDPEPFQAYLDKYPQGQFVDLALGAVKRKKTST